MAGRDGRGPLGEGPLTGRGTGACIGGNPGRGYSCARRSKRTYPGFRGIGLSRGNRFDSPRRSGMGLGFARDNFEVSEIDEEEFLKQEKRNLEERLEKITNLLED